MNISVERYYSYDENRIKYSWGSELKCYQRILGESDFVMGLLAEANEKYERFYELKKEGYDLEKVGQRITEIYDIEKSDIYSRGRRKIQAEARSLFCYWAVCELGMSRTNLAKRLSMA